MISAPITSSVSEMAVASAVSDVPRSAAIVLFSEFMHVKSAVTSACAISSGSSSAPKPASCFGSGTPAVTTPPPAVAPTSSLIVDS